MEKQEHPTVLFCWFQVLMSSNLGDLKVILPKMKEKIMLKSYTVLQKKISNTKKDLKYNHYHCVCLQTPQHSQDLMLGGKFGAWVGCLPLTTPMVTHNGFKSFIKLQDFFVKKCFSCSNRRPHKMRCVESRN